MAGTVTGVAVPKHSLSKLQSLNGLFAIYKKEGPTSADVLNSLKEALLKEAGVKDPNPRKRKKQALKMGHGGTLDSAASGVLVHGWWEFTTYSSCLSILWQKPVEPACTVTCIISVDVCITRI
uniref:TruB pseudouridine (psi) synthase family member 1 n=1 Tax=Hucho hucho TaxID=62062 RepID=A0A4W5QNF1_9TELE